MTRNISHQKSAVTRVYRKKLIKVATNRRHRHILCGDVQVQDLRGGGGQNGELNLSRDFQFLVDRDQSPLACKDLLCGHKAEREQEKREGKLIEQRKCWARQSQPARDVSKQRFGCKHERSNGKDGMRE